MKYLCSRWLGIALLALAPSAYSYDLLDARHAARDYNADFAAARANLSAGREQAIQGRAQLLPQVGASANYSYTHLTLLTNLPGYDSTSYGVSLKQPLFDISKYTGYQKGQIGTRQAEISFQASEQQLMLTIAQAYFKVLLAQDTLAATQASKKAYQTQLAQARAAFDVGTATITDTHEAQVILRCSIGAGNQRAE
ncbi:TolC family protein [Paludibacterium denitrificans]|uniref:TolC family protein n=1 Tax=Paludibacterium denitrificans TaxID=2675226 RepID=UPI001E60DC3C|nr:TolC family protein [Paludibacterium denitrificans]